MRKINKPTYISADVYKLCVDMVANAGLRKRLTDATPLITAAAREFDLKITKGKMHTIAREKIVNGNVTKEELEKVYTYRMAKKDAAGRTIYEAILRATKNGPCPFCSHHEADTIDHYLPKSEYPRLSVVPINLVPCCMFCNDEKDIFYPTRDYEELIHPYYDDIENDSWLDARIIRTQPCTVEYFVNQPGNWDKLLSKRVAFHFEKLKLAKMYGIQAAKEIAQIRFRLNSLLSSPGIGAVEKYLADAEETRSHDNLNSWQAVFYRAAMNDHWFKNGGFRLP